MNLVEALKSGKLFRRSGWGSHLYYENLIEVPYRSENFEGDQYDGSSVFFYNKYGSTEIGIEDILADDYEVKE